MSMSHDNKQSVCVRTNWGKKTNIVYVTERLSKVKIVMSDCFLRSPWLWKLLTYSSISFSFCRASSLTFRSALTKPRLSAICSQDCYSVQHSLLWYWFVWFQMFLSSFQCIHDPYSDIFSHNHNRQLLFFFWSINDQVILNPMNCAIENIRFSNFLRCSDRLDLLSINRLAVSDARRSNSSIFPRVRDTYIGIPTNELHGFFCRVMDASCWSSYKKIEHS